MPQEGSTVSRPDDNTSVQISSNYGVEIEPQTKLKGVKAKISTNTSGVNTIYLNDSSQNHIDSASSFTNGEVTLTATLNTGTKYYIRVDASTTGYREFGSPPYTSSDIDITSGYSVTTVSNLYGVNDITALLPAPPNAPSSLSATDV